MTGVPRTNVLRLLEKEGVSFEVKTYPWSEDQLDALHAARAMGVPPEQVFKTLCVLLDGRKTEMVLVSLAAPERVSMKKVAALLGAKSAEAAPLKELFALTGYRRGGCSPLGVAKKHRFVLDEGAFSCGQIGISGGERGLQVWLSPEDLARLTGAVIGNIKI